MMRHNSDIITPHQPEGSADLARERAQGCRDDVSTSEALVRRLVFKGTAFGEVASAVAEGIR
jgi:hypothetical protein